MPRYKNLEPHKTCVHSICYYYVWLTEDLEVNFQQEGSYAKDIMLRYEGYSF